MNILFLCTGNSARSILGEKLTSHIGKDLEAPIVGYSAGSNPVGKVNPVALEVLSAHGLTVDDARSKSWDVFTGPDGPQMDLIITVCDNAAGETCPVWPGHPSTAHWGLPDPAAVTGLHEDRVEAFEAVFETLKLRISALLELDLASLPAPKQQQGAQSLADLYGERLQRLKLP